MGLPDLTNTSKQLTLGDFLKALSSRRFPLVPKLLLYLSTMMRRVLAANQVQALSLAGAVVSPTIGVSSMRGIHGVRLTTSFMKPATADGVHRGYRYEEPPSTGKELPSGRGSSQRKPAEKEGDAGQSDSPMKPSADDVLRSDQTPF